ncbi:MAG: AI-2E family transporter [Oscillospiraceae bacterium]|nr:AI-2E family transporter [Oscillospiraceae bacterium]
MDKNYPLTPKERRDMWQRIGIRLAAICLSLVFIFVILPKIFGLLLPFLLAILFAFASNPAVKALTGKLRLSTRKPVTVMLLVAGLAGLFAVLLGAVYTAVADLLELAASWQYHFGNIRESLDIIAGRFNILPERVDTWLSAAADSFFDRAQELLEAFADRSRDTAGGLLSGASGIFIGIVTFILAAYFFTVDFTRFHAGASKKFGRAFMQRLYALRRSFRATVGGYIRQQFFLSALAFGIMIVGFLLLGQKYLLLIALFAAAVDFIPVLGTGTVLIPWGIVCLLAGRWSKGVAILAVWVVIKGTRLLIKSRLPKTKNVLNALQVIIFIYAGIKLGGPLGALWCPIAVMLMVQIWRTGAFEKTKKDFLMAFHDLTALCKRPQSGPKAQ